MSRPAVIAVGAALALAACDSPSPRFAAVDPVRVTVDGTAFSVRRSGGEAEAIRLARSGATGRRDLVLRGLLAIEAATGCPVLPGRWSGDGAMLRAALDCGPARTPVLVLDCTVVAIWKADALGSATEEFECGFVDD